MEKIFALSFNNGIEYRKGLAFEHRPEGRLQGWGGFVSRLTIVFIILIVYILNKGVILIIM